MNRYFDTHCHLDFDCFDGDRAGLLSRCKALGIQRFLIPATRFSVMEKLEALVSRHQGVYIAAGIHPFFVDKTSLSDLSLLSEYLKTSNLIGSKLIALGEMGLDKYCSNDFGLQKEVFSRQLEMASRLSLPVIIHNRKCDQTVLDLLDSFNVNKGVVHGFSGSYEIANEFRKRGFYIGLGGVISWENANKVRQMVTRSGLTQVVIETDAPDMSPEWLKGKRNTPETVIKVVALLAELLQLPVTTVADTVYRNSCNLFGLDGLGQDA